MRIDRHVLTRRSLLATGIALSAGLVAGCATKGEGGTDDLATDDLGRDAGAVGEGETDEVMDKVIPVEYNEAGTYTVSFTEADLLRDEVVSEAQREVTADSAPEIAPEIAPASGEEMTRDIRNRCPELG